LTPDEQFVEAAVRRIYCWQAAFATGITFGLLAWKGWWTAGGFAVGAALSILNFHWLKQGVDALAGHFQPAPAEAGGVPALPGGRRTLGRTALLVRFVLRYALIVAAGYVILRSSVLSLTAFLGGLLVFVAGILAEMIYELATGTGGAA
jgi:hypothetical protein